MKREKINSENYFEYFLDYIDGNLNDNEIEEVEQFIYVHPELRKELEGLEKTKLSPETHSYSYSENLLQIDLSLPVNEENFMFYCIAKIEGDLDVEQEQALNNYLINNPSKKADLDSYKYTQLKQDKNIILSNKRILKKPVFGATRRVLIISASMAASILIALGIWFGNSTMTSLESAAGVTAENKGENVAEKQEKEAAKQEKKEQEEHESVRDKSKEILKKIPEESKKVINKAASTISFKTGIPIASTDSLQLDDYTEQTVSQDPLVIAVNRIDPSQLTGFNPSSLITNDRLTPLGPIRNRPATEIQDPSEFLTLQEFAVQKLSDIIFNDEKKEVNAINLASAGIEKINSVAGTNMKLEASAQDESGKKKLKFNSRIISFSTPINRED